MIMLVSDNGARSEGGPTGSVNENLFFNNVKEDLQTNIKHIDELGDPTTFNHYPWGWTWAGDTPFRRWKRETYRGGICDPFIVHFPSGFKARARCAPSMRMSSTGCLRCWNSSDWNPLPLSKASSNPRSRVSVSRILSMMPKPRASITPSIRNARPPFHLPRWLAGSLPLARPFVHRGRYRFWNPIPAEN